MTLTKANNFDKSGKQQHQLLRGLVACGVSSPATFYGVWWLCLCGIFKEKALTISNLCTINFLRGFGGCVSFLEPFYGGLCVSLWEFYQQLFTGVLLRGLSRGVNVYWVQFESALRQLRCPRRYAVRAISSNFFTLV